MQADIRTCNTLDKTARTGTLAVVLVTVDDFVNQNAVDLIRASIRAVHDVLACEVNLLGSMRASCVGYTIHGSKDELYGFHTVSGALAIPYCVFGTCSHSLLWRFVRCHVQPL